MSNPLTQDQLRRVDAWLAENLFGYVRALYTYYGGEQVWIVAPSEMQAIPCLEPTTKPITRFNDPHLPAYTSPDSPRRLLEEAEERCIEKLNAQGKDGGGEWATALDKAANSPASSVRGRKMLLADSVTHCRAIVEALGGNWSEVIGE